MKATGIVRRIDDLGRIVIPKEIRRTLRIKEGDPLEIFTDREGEVILKKYSQVGELGKFAAEFAESLAQTSGHGVCITDRDQIVAAAGGMKRHGPDVHGIVTEQRLQRFPGVVIKQAALIGDKVIMLFQLAYHPVDTLQGE